jgi:PAS domain S-box-containing protein
MTKLNLTVDAQTLHVTRCDTTTRQVLNCTFHDGSEKPVLLADLLSDNSELDAISAVIEELVASYCHENPSSSSSSSNENSFQTLNLVFRAPGAKEAAMPADRTPMNGVFRSPLRAIHLCGALEISTFCHVQLLRQQDLVGTEPATASGQDPIRLLVEITAVEYSRKHRQQLLQQEFGSWLLEEHIEEAVIATTLMGEVCFWNRFASELYQYERQEVMGKNIMELIPAEMSQEQGMEIMGKLMTGEHWKGMFKVQRKDKSNFMAHVTDTPIMGQDGSIKFIVGVSADYTQLHDLMEQLKEFNANLESQVMERTTQLLEREKFLRLVGAAVKESDTGVLITNDQDQVIWSNDAVRHLLGTSGTTNDDEFQGVRPWELSCLSQDRVFQDFLQTSMVATKTTTTTKVPLSPPNDHDAATPAVGDGSVATTATSPSLTMEMDVRGRLPVDYLSVNVQVLHHFDEELHMITIRDESAKKLAAEAQINADKASEASRIKTEMMQMLSHELRSPLQGIMGMSSTMLEDIRLGDGIQDREIHDGISTILASSRLLLTLINNVLDLRRMESQMMQEIPLSPVSLAECLENSKGFCHPFAAQQHVQLNIVTSPLTTGGKRQRCVMGNQLRCEQVLINLITNGIKYSSQRGGLELSIRSATAQEAFQEALLAPASDVKLLSAEALKIVSEQESSSGKSVSIVSVRDHGPGIPAHESWKVFGEFSQLDLSARKDATYTGEQHGGGSGEGGGATINHSMVAQSSGTGLGLNLVLKFVTAMHGHVWFQSIPPELGGGTDFLFSLPETMDFAPVSMPRRPSETQPISNFEDVFNVLVVDDSMINLKVIGKMLTRLGVKSVETATRGSKALDYLKQQLKEQPVSSLPNLIISDVNMPEMDGFELRRQIAELNLPSHPYTFAWTANFASEVEDQSREAGFDGVLCKPVTIRDLENLLTGLLTKGMNPQC